MSNRIKMTLKEYLTGYSNELGKSNFNAYDAVMLHGGKITAHHGRDKSTEKYYAEMQDGQYLVTYKMPEGDFWRCQAINGDMPVTCTKTK